ncbi:MAG: DUF4276 family protein [Candidatus Freyarchaeota archaeon]|nr:DUF4276 family protein [Candidatus Jordarchaeia archaeon]
MKIGLIVEDRYPEAIKKICEKIGINTEIRRQRGRINVRKAASHAKTLLNTCEKVIILPDAHCNPQREKERVSKVYSNLPQELKGRVKICVIVHEIESWLLADENSLSQHLKFDSKIAHPEEICNAKEYLEQIFKKSGKTYLTSMAKEIATQIDINKVSQKCPSFKNFIEIAKDC